MRSARRGSPGMSTAGAIRPGRAAMWGVGTGDLQDDVGVPHAATLSPAATVGGPVGQPATRPTSRAAAETIPSSAVSMAATWSAAALRLVC